MLVITVSATAGGHNIHAYRANQPNMLMTYLQALGMILSMGIVTWLYSLYRRDVSIIDSMWSLMLLAAALLYAWQSSELGLRSALVLTLVAIWAVRLSMHLIVRNRGEPEDRRYQEIRRNNEPHFSLKSLYIVFGLQGFLAWIISVPLLFALQATALHWLDALAVALWSVGFICESMADWQLYQFKKNDVNQGKVFASGLWRYSRHPNYFGEFCIWWGFYLLAIPAGGWWTIYAPALMTLLLLKVSGVGLMERDIGDRRTAYKAYIKRTNAFFPGLPHDACEVALKEQAS